MRARALTAAILLFAAAPGAALQVTPVASPRTVASWSLAAPRRTYVLLAGAPWCTPCRTTLAPLEAARPASGSRLARAAVAHVDLDALEAGAFEAFAARYGVPFEGTIPLAVVFRRGIAVAGHVGALDAGALERLLRDAERVRLPGAERRRRSCGRRWSGPCVFLTT